MDGGGGNPVVPTWQPRQLAGPDPLTDRPLRDARQVRDFGSGQDARLHSYRSSDEVKSAARNHERYGKQTRRWSRYMTSERATG